MNRQDSPDNAPTPAFPLEAIFPGLHAERPDIASKEAEDFLAHGSGPRGFPLDDPDARRWLTDPAWSFIDFQIAPVPPEWTVRLANLASWEHSDADTVGAALTADLAARVPGMRADLTIRILEDKEVWVCRR